VQQGGRHLTTHLTMLPVQRFLQVNHIATFLDNAVSQGEIAEKVFAFYLGNNAPGELTIGPSPAV
jgi:hypothetical protein